MWKGLGHLDEEGVTWVRGHVKEGSPAGDALLAAYTLGERPLRLHVETLSESWPVKNYGGNLYSSAPLPDAALAPGARVYISSSATISVGGRRL